MTTASSKDWVEQYGQTPDQAWEAFLQHHNRLIMAVIRKLVHDDDDVMDLYAYTVEKLRDNDCKKLTAYFSKPRNYTFETWIAVVVRNGCLDWFRKGKGRKRLLKCIEALAPLEQWIFRYVYWHRYSYEMTYQMLKSKHGFSLKFSELANHLNKISHTLREAARIKVAEDLKFILVDFSEEQAEELGHDEASGKEVSSPEDLLIQNDSTQILQQALISLSTEEQLLIQLHFYRNLSLNEIARILKMKNLWRVRRKLQKALKALKNKLQEKGIGPSDLEIL